jgi:hypothetical protein
LFLAGVSDRFAHRVDMAGQSGFRDDPAAPNHLNQVVLGHHALAVLHQVKQQIEDLWPERDRPRPAGELPPVRIEHVIFESKPHRRSMTWASKSLK